MANYSNLVFLIVYSDNYDCEKPLAVCSDRESAEEILSNLKIDRTCEIIEYEINRVYNI